MCSPPPPALAYLFRVHLARLRLRDFRNYPRLDVDFGPGFHVLLGDNAQGKTNILEAIYLLATLRSFRGVGGAHLVRHGQAGYFVGGTFVGQGEHESRIYWSTRERKLALDGQPVRRLADYLGVLRAVVFCTCGSIDCLCAILNAGCRRIHASRVSTLFARRELYATR